MLRHWATQHLTDDFTSCVRSNLQSVRRETSASLRLLHEQLAGELRSIDLQEENLLDLAADGSLATDKVRTRLTGLQTQRKKIQARLADNDDRLEAGAAVLEAQLELLQTPRELYRQLNDHGRRLLNQAMFEELLIDQEDLTSKVVGQTYTEPIRDLMLAAQAYREQSISHSRTTERRPAVNGEPAWGTLTALLRPVSLDGGWSKTAMVGLLARYSNHSEYLDNEPKWLAVLGSALGGGEGYSAR